MDKNINVSIAGIPFSLESNAYKILKDYLVRIEMGYKNNPEGREIIDDIEARIAELVLNEQSAETPIKENLIKNIVEQLGMPDDIETASPITEHSNSTSISRRLYRNPDGAKLGGVCNGLATYFNVEPVIVRLIFCSPLILIPVSGFISGSLAGFLGTILSAVFMLYFILWFAVPKAKSPRQKLEMQGSKITASTIHQNFHEDFEEINPSPKSERNASALADLVYVVGKIALFCLKAFALLIGGVLAIVAIFLVFGFIALATGSHSEYFGTMLTDLNIHGIGIPALMTMGLLIAIIPMVIIGYIFIRLVFNMPTGKKTLSILFGIWMIVMIYLGAMFIRNFENIRDGIKDGSIEYYFEQYDYNNYHKHTGTIDITGDTIMIETNETNGQMVNDTVKIEYFTE